MKKKDKNYTISAEVKDPQYISFAQNIYAQKAIVWLLSKAPHSIEEISNHFEISNELTEHLIECLIKKHLVFKVVGCPTRYKR